MTHPLNVLCNHVNAQIAAGSEPVVNVAPEQEYEVTIKRTIYVYQTAKMTVSAQSEAHARQAAFDQFHVDELAIDFTGESVEHGDETFTAVLKG